MPTLIDIAIRWRTWLVNVIGIVLLALPELLNAPEVIAVIPADWQKWVFLAALLLNIWMRPRPAVRARDPEADITRLRKTYGDDHTGIGA